MYLLETETDKGTVTRDKILKAAGVTENELTLDAMNEALERLNRPVNLTIWIDREYVAGAIVNGWPERWEKAGWINAKGRKVANADRWELFMEKTRIHEVSVKLRDRHEYRSWMTRTLEEEQKKPKEIQKKEEDKC